AAARFSTGSARPLSWLPPDSAAMLAADFRPPTMRPGWVRSGGGRGGEMTQPVAAPDAPRILIVDDDPAVRDVISVLLTEEGYDAISAVDAENALDAVAAQETHLVIADLKMPGHDGMWLLDQLRAEHPDTAVIMLTGFGDTENAVECLRRGAADYLLKPPRVTDLIRAIERALARRR